MKNRRVPAAANGRSLKMSKTYIKIIGAFTPLLVIVACGQVPQPGNGRRVTANAYGLNIGSGNGNGFPVPPPSTGNGNTISEFVCPTEPNIKPYVNLTNGDLNDYFNSDQLGDPGVFEVCISSRDQKLLEISGTPMGNENSIHVVPLKRGANGGYYTLASGQVGVPLVFAQAKDPQGKFRILTTTTDFQRVIIVSSTAINALMGCIQNPALRNQCPAYSTGMVR